MMWDEKRVLAALLRVPGDGWATPDQLLADTDRLAGFSKNQLGRVMVRLHKRGWVSLISGPRRYRATVTGRGALSAAAADDDHAGDWAGRGFDGVPAAQHPAVLAEGENVSEIIDLPGTDPIACIGVTTHGRLLYGTRTGKGWAHRPEWTGKIFGPLSAVQEALETVHTGQRVIERQRYPSTLREKLRQQLRLEHAATLRDLELIFVSVPGGIERNTLINELARMRDDQEIRFHGPRYVWNG